MKIKRPKTEVGYPYWTLWDEETNTAIVWIHESVCQAKETLERMGREIEGHRKWLKDTGVGELQRLEGKQPCL